VPDYAKRGYNKRCEDAFADLEKTIAALPADQAEQFRGALSKPRLSVSCSQRDTVVDHRVYCDQPELVSQSPQS
jgi:hypothetical protein